MEGKINKQLKKVLKKIVKEAHEPLAVADAKLGGVIKVELQFPFMPADQSSPYSIKTTKPSLCSELFIISSQIWILDLFPLHYIIIGFQYDYQN